MRNIFSAGQGAALTLCSLFVHCWQNGDGTIKPMRATEAEQPEIYATVKREMPDGVWRRQGAYQRILELGPLSVPEALRN